MKIIRTCFMLIVVAIVMSPAAAIAQETVPPWHRDFPGGRQQAQITVGTTPVTVDLAISPEQQSLGLGYRNGLEPDHGMLFVSNSPAVRTFWMKGMRFCLDIIWIQDGVITGAAENVCPDPDGTLDQNRPTVNSRVPVTYVLEMDAGWLADHGYGPGTPVDLTTVPGTN